MIIDVEVPNQGLTITEATLVRWAKQPGETVQKGDILFEIETDKAVQEIECPQAGVVVAHLAQVGDVVPLGRVVAQIGTEVADGLEAMPTRSAERPDAAPISAVPVTSGNGAVSSVAAEASNPSAPTPRPSVGSRERREVVPSPRARRAAERLGIDLALVQPTGGRGRHIRERDVLRAAEEIAVRQSWEAALPPVVVAAPAAPVLHTPTAPLRPPGRLRQITAERTAAAFRDTPHFYLTREVSAERLVALRAEMVADLEALAGVRVTITDLLVKALALTLRDFPTLNAQWRDGEIVPLESVDIGLAVDTPNGLVVPVFRAADRATLCELARQRREFVERAGAGRLRPEDMAGGSFTLSNLGGLDVDQFEAIINPPQSGILAVGTIKPRPYIVEEQLAVCKTVFLTLSMDHRVTDGAEAGRFFRHLVHLIERPALLCAL